MDWRKGTAKRLFRANGTGPTACASVTGVRTPPCATANYWGKIDGNVDEVIFHPHRQRRHLRRGAAREIDVMEFVPVQDRERSRTAPSSRCRRGLSCG